MKMAVIGGAGLLGSTTAFCVGYKHLVEEIKLIDIRDNMVASHCMDMTQAFLPFGKTKVTKASYEDIGDCDFIICAASVPEGKVKDRADILGENIKLMIPICENIKKYGRQDAVVLISAAPIDVWAYVFWKLIGWQPNQFIGFSVNDALRLKWALELVTGKEYEKLDACVIGEHGGDGQVRLYDQIKYDGQPLALSKEELTQVESMTANWFKEWQALECGRTTGWTSAVMMTKMIEAMINESNEVIPASTPLVSEFGYPDVAMGMPCLLGRCGVRKVVDPELTEAQKAQMDRTAAKLKGQIAQVPMNG